MSTTTTDLTTAEALASKVLATAKSSPAEISALTAEVPKYVSEAGNVITTAAGYVAEMKAILESPAAQDVISVIEQLLALTHTATTKVALNVT